MAAAQRRVPRRVEGFRAEALTQCYAQEAPAQPANADWVFGAFAGGAHTNDTSLTLRQPAAGTDVTFARVRLSPTR
jgi:hypothetical protein